MSSKDIVLAAAGAGGPIPPPPSPTDPYWADVTLLTNSANQLAFADASTNNLPITNTGGVTPSLNSPYNPAIESVYFDGSSYLTTPSETGFAFSGDFTIEGWFYTTTSSYVRLWQFSNDADNCEINIGSGYINYYNGGGSVQGYASMSTNTWIHIAIVRQSGTITGYINGVSVLTSSSSGTSSRAIGVGGYNNTYYQGNISNFRIVNGTAIYTANFTPPAAPLTAVSGTALLTCQQDGFVDNSTNNYAITLNGAPTLSTNSPFLPSVTNNYNSGSMYFNGSSTLDITAGTAPLNLGTNDFTIEAWVYPTSTSGGNKCILGWGNPTYGAIQVFYNFSGSENVDLHIWGDDLTSTNGSVPLNTWTHIAFTRVGTAWNVYINGVLNATVTGISYDITEYSAIGIGSNSNNAENYYGFISNLRVVNGTALYTSNFALPTAPLTAVSGTSLLINGTNQNTFDNSTFVDQSNNAYPITANGTPLYAGFSPYGNQYPGSVYFDGSSYLTGTGALNSSTTFTAEAWVYLNTSGVYAGVITTTSAGSSPDGWGVRITNTEHVEFGETWYTNSITSSQTVPTNQWVHIAVQRDGSGNSNIWINGIKDSATNTFTVSNYNSTDFAIGNDYYNFVEGEFPGFIADVRVVSGTALYSGNFVPPSQPLPNISGTTLLMNANTGGFYDLSGNDYINEDAYLNVFSRDSSPSNRYVSNIGTVTPSLYTPFSGGIGGSMRLNGSNYLVAEGDLSQAGDFTIEGWYYLQSLPGPQVLVFIGNESADRHGFYVDSSGNLVDSYWGVGDNYFGASLTTNTWYHIAFVRSGSTITAYVNGVSTPSTTTFSGTFGNINGAYIGCDSAPYGYATGFFSNIRITPSAVYTSNFTPSTTPLTASANTQLLINATNQGQNNDSTFVDQSPNAYALTPNGSPAYSALNPNPGYIGSYYLDGSSWLGLPTTITLSGDFTAEFWVNQPSVSVNPCIWTNSFFERTSWLNSTTFEFNGGAPGYTVNTWTVPDTTTKWAHYALVRSGSNVTLYVDGISMGTQTNTNGPGINQLFTYNSGSPSGYSLVGNVADFRIVNGTALYSANFTPPSTPLPVVSNTALLMNGNTGFLYGATLVGGNPIAQSGAPLISLQSSPFTALSESYYFDGSSYLTLPWNAGYDLVGDFTVELWINLSTAPADYQMLLSTDVNNSYFTIRATSFEVGWVGGGNSNFTHSLSANTWYHVALTRSGSTVYCFQDGVSLGTDTNTSSLFSSATNLFVASWYNGSDLFPGYMNNVRITNGVARYTAPFTPPTAPFPTQP